MIDHRLQVDDLAERGPHRTPACEELEQTDIAHHPIPGVGALHLDHDALSARQRGAMHLRDRSRSKRFGFDGIEHVLPRHPQLLLHCLHDLRLGQRRDPVAQGREFLDERTGKQVRARRKDLAELAEGGPKLFERESQSPRALLGSIVATVAERIQFGEPVLHHHAGDVGGASRQHHLDM